MNDKHSYTLGTERGHIFQDMNTGEYYLLARPFTSQGRAAYTLHNMKTGMSRASSYDRLFWKGEWDLVTAQDLNTHFNMSLRPVQRIDATQFDLPDLRKSEQVDKALREVQAVLNSMTALSGKFKVVVI